MCSASSDEFVYIYNIKTENVTEFGCLEITLTNQNCITKSIKSRLSLMHAALVS